MFTKTEIRILELFTSNITSSFTIREVSRLISKDLKIVHSSIKQLLEKKYLLKDKEIFLNYKSNIAELAFIETLRAAAFLAKNSLLNTYVGNFIKKSKTKFFTLMVFGSYASGKQKKDSDIDLIAITPDIGEGFERSLKSSFSARNLKLHLTCIDQAGFLEMLRKRDELNVVNESLNNHILLYGAEQYYAMLEERDVN